MDVKHAIDACAVVTLSKDSNLRDVAQGCWRMRGLDRGQNVHFLVPLEVCSLIDIAEARSAVKSKDLQLDKNFNDQAKQAMLEAGLAAAGISDIEEPKWQGMSAEQVARVLADQSIDYSDLKDVAVATAIELAPRVAEGNAHAAREVVARAAAVKIHASHKHAENSNSPAAVVMWLLANLMKSELQQGRALAHQRLCDSWRSFFLSTDLGTSMHRQ